LGGLIDTLAITEMVLPRRPALKYLLRLGSTLLFTLAIEDNLAKRAEIHS